MPNEPIVQSGKTAHFRTLKRYLLVAVACICAISLWWWADQRNGPKYSLKAKIKAKALQKHIRAEIARLKNHSWAGEYYFGDGLGVNVRLLLAPQSGHVFEWHGCLGLYDRNYGTVTETNGRLRLTFTFENERKAFMGLAEELIPVAWGPRKYLLPANRVVGFCNQINSGAEPRSRVQGRYFLRRGDETKSTSGFPLLPQEYRPFLREQPIVARIIAVGTSSSRPTLANGKVKDSPVTLDAGKAEGLLPGMELFVIEPSTITIQTVTVTTVEDHTAQAVIIDSDPQAGWKLSTRWRNQQKIATDKQ